MLFNVNRMETVEVRIPERILKEIDNYTEEGRLTRSDVIRNLLEKAINRRRIEEALDL